MRALVIQPNGDMEEKTLDTYDALKNEIGGWLEVVRFDDGVWCYIDEDGKGKGLDGNAVATAMATMLKAGLGVHDFIVGPAIIVGPPDAEGNDTNCPDRIFAWQVLYLALTTNNTSV